MANNNYYTIIGTGIFILLIIVLLVIFYFEQENSDKIVDKVINNTHLYVPSEHKSVISENLKTNIKQECPKIPVEPENKPESEFPAISTPEDMPWDETIEYCKNNKGTILDIDFNQTLLDYKPKVILY